MKNFPIMHEGKEYWISRNIATATFIFGYKMGTENGNEIYVLAGKRSKNTPDEQGKWCCPCGYLDYDETLEQCAVRETFEETGLEIEEQFLKQMYINSNPSENKQNVTVRYKYILGSVVLYEIPDGYKNYEVDEVKWINVKDLSRYNWAFDHDIIIKGIV